MFHLITTVVLIKAVVAAAETEFSQNCAIPSNPCFVDGLVNCLLSKRNSDLHWGSSTWFPLLGLSESQKLPTSWNQDSLEPSESKSSWNKLPETKVAMKQLDIELLLAMLERQGNMSDTDYWSIATHHAVTLTSLCRDPKNFYGHNIINGLVKSSSASEFAYAYKLLTTCGANGSIWKKDVSRLAQMLTVNHPFNDTDTIAISIMAANCIGNNYPYPNLLLLTRNYLRQLSSLQNEEGYFGNMNLVSTALAVQAFSTDYNYCSSATLGRQWLLTQQNPCTDYISVVETILAFKEGGRAAINLHHCQNPERVTRDPEEEAVVFNYHVWPHSAPNFPRLKLKVSKQTSMFEAMKKAANINPDYKFDYKCYPGIGYMITSIGGYPQDEKENLYWMLYVLPFDPNNGNPNDFQKYLSKTGVDNTYPRTGEHVLFWLKFTQGH